MQKVQMEILAISANPSSNGAHALILKEVEGKRRLPIVIGAYEAHAIYLELQGFKPERPLTHDLIKNVLDSIGVSLLEIWITDLKDSTFFAKLIFDTANSEIDARPSDAIALAVRCNVPMYVSEEVLEDGGFLPDDDNNFLEDVSFSEEEDERDELLEGLKSKSTEEEAEAEIQHTVSNILPTGVQSDVLSKVALLNQELDHAISHEDYERAARIRDELTKILNS
jgi:hypothetical protein